MNASEKQEIWNTTVYVFGLILTCVGLAWVVVGGIFVLNDATVQNILLDGGDGWITFMAVHRFDLVWAGFMVSCFGIPLSWQAQDNQDRLALTNRLVDFTERRSYRRTGGV